MYPNEQSLAIQAPVFEQNNQKIEKTSKVRARTKGNRNSQLCTPGRKRHHSPNNGPPNQGVNKVQHVNNLLGRHHLAKIIQYAGLQRLQDKEATSIPDSKSYIMGEDWAMGQRSDQKSQPSRLFGNVVSKTGLFLLLSIVGQPSKRPINYVIILSR